MRIPSALRSELPESLPSGAAPPAAQATAAPAASEPATRAIIPPPQALTDAAITSRIRSEIAADPSMAGADVSVNTDKGVVVLAGTVKSREQTGIASAHAQRQDGVLRVDNLLQPVLS
jgi:hyperosmotically inducible protein